MRKFWIGLGCCVGLWAQEERRIFPLRAEQPRVSGRVIDARTGEGLPGVQVSLGQSGTFSDQQGFFQLPFHGPDTLRAFLLGYRTVKVPLTAPVASLLLRVTPLESQLDTVRIVSEVSRETEAGLFLERLRSLEIGELYAQEAILKRSTDFYVPNALRRMPGVSLLSGRFISIRGLSERYNSYAFWAAYPAWTRYDGSFGEVEELITTLLGRVEVRKSWTPDLLGHFGGGMVDFQLPQPGRQEGLQVAYTSEIDLSATARPFPLLRGPVQEPLPRDFPAPAAVQASENAGRPLPENFAYGKQVRRYTIPDTLPYAWPGGLLTLLYERRGNHWAMSLRGALSQRYLASQMQFSDGSFEEVDGKWRFVPTLVSQHRHPVRYFSRSGGGALSLSYAPSSKHTFLLEAFGLTSSAQRTMREESHYLNPDIDSTQLVYSLYPTFLVQRSYLTIGRLNWTLLPSEKNVVRTQVGVVFQGHAIPQAGAMNYVRYPGDSLIRYEQELYGESEIYAQVWTSRTRAWQMYAHPYAEWKWGLPDRWLQLRIGAWASREEQRFTGRQLGFMTDTAGGGPAVLDPAVYLWENVRHVYDPAYIGPGGWYLIERTTDYHRHRGLTSILAGYGWLRVGFSAQLEALLGGRYEYWHRTLYYTPLATEVEAPLHTYHTGHWLPAFLLKYALTERQSLRLATTLTLIRPPLPAQVPLAYFDYLWAYYWRGDTALTSGRSYNLDLRYEWLQDKENLLAITLFYKRLYNLPEQYLIPASFQLTFMYSLRNRAWGEIGGIELEARKTLYHQGDNRLWLYFTGTLSESAAERSFLKKLGRLEGRLQGQAPIVINAGALFESKRWELSNFLNYTSAQIWALGFDPTIYPHILEEKRFSWEVQASYRLSSHWEVRIAWWDILNQPYRRTQRAFNANQFDPNRDNVANWEKAAYRTYLTVRYQL